MVLICLQFKSYYKNTRKISKTGLKACFTLNDEANVELAVGIPSVQLITWLTDDVASPVLQDTISIDLQCSPNLLDGRRHHFQHNLGDCLCVLKQSNQT